MFNHKLKTTLAVLAATAGLGAFATTANAVVVDEDGLIADGVNVDLDGDVAFDWTDGLVTPKLTGRLVATNAGGNRVRVRVDSYTADGAYLNTEYGNAMDVPDDLEHAWTVNRPGISDPLTAEVVVAVEMETLLAGWETQEDVSLDLNTFGDSFTIERPGIAVAGAGWSGGAPVDSSHVGWSIDDGQATAEFNRLRLHLHAALGECGRITVNYLTVGGAPLDSVSSPRRCASTNGHQDWNLTSEIPPYTSSLLGQVEVVAETRAGGQWNRAGGKTLSIAQDD